MNDKSISFNVTNKKCGWSTNATSRLFIEIHTLSSKDQCYRLFRPWIQAPAIRVRPIPDTDNQIHTVKYIFPPPTILLPSSSSHQESI